VLALTGHRAPAPCLTFSPDGRTLASGSGDGTVLVWDLLRSPGPIERSRLWEDLASKDA
jgi:WD40 repeat protein